MKLNTLLSAAALSLVFSISSFNAVAMSSPQLTGLDTPMISIQRFGQTDYSLQEVTKMFPAPSAGMVQHILTLPKLENEDDYMIEIQIGQTKMVDCNKHRLNGELKERTVEGWGYNYYQVDEISAGPSTMMACSDTAKQSAFIQIPDELILRYDSRLPNVFYLPEGTEIRVRTWKVDSTYQYSK
ncbi:serine protease inhibitor ecotin [Shewanella morhuae]|uniref:serine protease inhibitor ecotin n=1 Tax=Shewanella morhuae TaxID=365591 RepID=UPI001BBC59B7|nr:serine protease inhibitor ecotin [Shewanella morhuae]GIU14022.1 ecotin [Shewanella morhuae]